MGIRATLRPGRRGTKRWQAIYGDRLVCVRYRYDAGRRRRYTTVEVIVAEAPWLPSPPAPETMVGVKVDWGEVDVARAIKAAGGRWEPSLRLWKLRYDQVLALDLLDRLVLPEG